KTEYIAIINNYLREVALANTQGYDYPVFTATDVYKAFALQVGEKQNTSNSVQEKPGVLNSPKKVVTEKDEKVEKTLKIAKVRERKALSLKDKINEANAKEVFASLRKTGLINDSNIKQIGFIITKNKGNDVLITQGIVEFLTNKGVAEETIIENCNL
ncbi:MAG: hypothetical protein ACSLE0_08095, partial [Chitinophagaceae bacterium]